MQETYKQDEEWSFHNNNKQEYKENMNYPLMQVILATDLCDGLMVVRVPSLRISASS